MTSVEERDMGAGIIRRRAPHEWPASWLRATLLVVLGLGGLAGCAPLPEVAPPELGRSLDGVRQEVAQLRAETAQLGAALRISLASSSRPRSRAAVARVCLRGLNGR